MEMLLYLVLGAVLYGVLADRTDRAVDREMEKRRREHHPELRLVDAADEECAGTARDTRVLHGFGRVDSACWWGRFWRSLRAALPSGRWSPMRVRVEFRQSDARRGGRMKFDSDPGDGHAR